MSDFPVAVATSDPIIKTDQLGPGFFALHNALGERCYLLAGTNGAVLVDAMGGMGNVRRVAESLIAPGLALDVVLTHKHIDHVGGSYWFRSVGVPEHETVEWDTLAQDAEKYLADAIESGVVPADIALATRDGARPQTWTIRAGEGLDLGGRTVLPVELPGHTRGSMAYLCPDLNVLLAGDAVTPIMCLCFEDSLSIEEWQQTLTKMEGLPFERFYTGHHEAPFTKADLAGWRAAGDFAKTDRGFEWHHSLIEGWEGTCHLCPCDTYDADSPDFRAIITRGLPPKRVRKRAR